MEPFTRASLRVMVPVQTGPMIGEEAGIRVDASSGGMSTIACKLRSGSTINPNARLVAVMNSPATDWARGLVAGGKTEASGTQGALLRLRSQSVV